MCLCVCVTVCQACTCFCACVKKKTHKRRGGRGRKSCTTLSILCILCLAVFISVNNFEFLWVSLSAHTTLLITIWEKQQSYTSTGQAFISKINQSCQKSKRPVLFPLTSFHAHTHTHTWQMNNKHNQNSRRTHNTSSILIPVFLSPNTHKPPQTPNASYHSPCVSSVVAFFFLCCVQTSCSLLSAIYIHTHTCAHTHTNIHIGWISRTKFLLFFSVTHKQSKTHHTILPTSHCSRSSVSVTHKQPKTHHTTLQTPHCSHSLSSCPFSRSFLFSPLLHGAGKSGRRLVPFPQLLGVGLPDQAECLQRGVGCVCDGVNVLGWQSCDWADSPVWGFALRLREDVAEDGLVGEGDEGTCTLLPIAGWLHSLRRGFSETNI